MPGHLKLQWAQARGASGNDLQFSAFLTRPPDNILYFTPIAVQLAIAHYPGSMPCPAPSRLDVQACNSDVRSLEICLPDT